MKSSAIAANSKGLREGHVLNRWIEGYGTSHLPWQNIQHNKSLKPTALRVARTLQNHPTKNGLNSNARCAPRYGGLVPPLDCLVRVMQEFQIFNTK